MNFMVVTKNKKYTAALAKIRALIPETIKVFQVYESNMKFDELEKIVLDKGILAPLSTKRVTDLMRQAIKKRFFSDDSLPQTIKALIRVPKRELDQILYVHAARSDDFLKDIIIEEYYQIVEDRKNEITKNDIKIFLSEAVRKGNLPKLWNDNMIEYVLQGLFQTMVEFGLIKKGIGDKRELQKFSPEKKVLLYLAYDLHFSGLSDQAVVMHEDWKLFMLNENKVHEALKDMSYEQHLIYQYSGDILQITWLYKYMDEVIDAIIR